MDTSTKRYLGQILGQIYRLQQHADPELCPPVSNKVVHGLIAGVESEIDSVLDGSSFLSVEAENHVADYLNRFFKSRSNEGLEYWSMEHELSGKGLDRMQIGLALTHFLLSHRFVEQIEHLQQNIPAELRDLNPDSYEVYSEVRA